MNEAVNSVYLAVSSADSLQYFPNNNPTHFTTLLNVPLELAGDWSIALREIVLQLSNGSRPLSTPILFDVFVTDASGAVLSGMESTLVSRVCAQTRKGKRTVSVRFESCDFVPLRTHYLDRVEVTIKPVFPSSLSFDTQTTAYATLVLRKPE